MKKGFTLIELLVVVLIIGILAAIALPQYQKAVERSRMAEAMQVLGNFAQGQSIYYMQHGRWAEYIMDTDVTLPVPGDAFEYEGPYDALEGGVSLTAIRAAGIYQGGILSIAIEPNGAIHKNCVDPEEQTGFCTMAEAAGYIPVLNPGGKEPGSGTIFDGGGNSFNPLIPLTPCDNCIQR